MNDLSTIPDDYSFYKDFYEKAPIAFFSVNPEKKIIRCNDVSIKLLGYSRSEYLTMNIFDLYANTPNGLPRAQLLFSKFLKGNIIEGEELQMKHKSGKSIWISLTVNAIKDENGKIMESRSIVMDISKRKIKEERFNEAEKEFTKELQNVKIELESIYEYLPQPVMLIDKDRRVRKANRMALEFSQRKESEILGLRGGEAIRCLNSLNSPQGCGYGPECQNCIIRKTVLNSFSEKTNFYGVQASLPFDINGVRSFFHFIISTVYLELPEESYVLLTIKDITKRIEAEKEIKRINHFFNNFVENAQAPIFIKDKNGIYQLVNKYYEELFGIKKKRILGSTDYYIQPNNPELVNLLIKNDKVVLEEKRSIIFKEVISARGKLRKFQTIKFPLYDDNDILLIGGLAIDITDLEETEQKLKESEARYHTLFEQGPDMIFIINPENGGIIESNNRVFDILGYTPQEMKDKKLSDFEVKETSIEIKQHIADIIREDEDLFETQHRTKSGEIKDIMVSVRRVDIEGKPYLQAYCRDITEKKRAEQKLRESERMYRTIVDSSPIGIGLSTFDGKVITMNKTLEKITGYSFEEFKKINLKESYVYPKQRDLFINILEKHGKVRDFEVKLKHKDGSIYIALYNSDLINIGGVVLLHNNIMDITQIRNSEIKLRESEENFRSLVEVTSDWIWQVDKKGVYTYSSPRIFDLLGYYPNEIIGKKPFDFMPLEEAERVSAIFGKHLKEEKPLSQLENTNIHKDGQQKILETSAVPVFDFEGFFIGYRGIDRNITERKRAENKIKESEEKYRTLFESSKDGIALLDEMGKFVDCNKSFIDFTGYTKNEILELNRLDIIIPKYHNVEKYQYSLILNRGYSDKYEIEIIRKDNKVIPLNIIGWVRKDKQDKTIGAWGIIRDISKQKEAERLIIEENKKLVELDKMRNDIIARISHEFRTPLTSIFGASQLLTSMEKDNFSEDFLRIINILNDGIYRLKALVDNLINVSLLDTRKIKLDRQNANLNEIIRQSIKESKNFADNRNLSITFIISEETVNNVDKNRLGQAITNLLSNAIKNTPSGGKIIVDLLEKEEYSDIVIKDTGVGITKGEKEKLFKKFGKIERYGMDLDVDIEGSGLGLYLSKEIVEMHNGKIFVESEGKNKGSTFTIRLFK